MINVHSQNHCNKTMACFTRKHSSKNAYLPLLDRGGGGVQGCVCVRGVGAGGVCMCVSCPGGGVCSGVCVCPWGEGEHIPQTQRQTPACERNDRHV